MSNLSLDESKNPQSFLKTASWAFGALPLNGTVRVLENDFEAQLKIAQKLKDLGQSNFIILARKCLDAMETLPLYAGDGVVFKVFPEKRKSQVREHIFTLPAITEDIVESDKDSYVIQSFPYVPKGGVKQEDIELLRQELENVGLEFTSNDGNERNIHRLPDSDGTLVGIDPDMVAYVFGNKSHEERAILDRQWKQYIRDLYPIYNVGAVPRQTENTNFDFISVHDPMKSRKMSFWSRLEEPNLAIDDVVLSKQSPEKLGRLKMAVRGLLFGHDDVDKSDLTL